jgi:hypothetical protein
MWITARRTAGMLLVGALAFSALLYAYWASGGTWGLAVMQGEAGPLRAFAWPLWVTAALLSGWTFIVVAAVRGWGGATWARFHRVSCWVIAVVFLLLALGSFQSPSGWERMVVGPVAILLSLSGAAIALGLRQTRPSVRVFL